VGYAKILRDITGRKPAEPLRDSEAAGEKKGQNEA
jgi:hypothetical protein